MNPAELHLKAHVSVQLPGATAPPTYEAIRTQTSLYVEYADGAKEYHDLVADPHELRNTFSSLPNEEKTSLHAALDAIVNCHDAKSCWAAERGSRIARGSR